MSWLIELLKGVGELILFILLVPIVLVVGSLIIMPFEKGTNFFFKKSDSKETSKLKKVIYSIIGITITAIPVVLIFIYEINKG
jgi:hypothetical protein